MYTCNDAQGMHGCFLVRMRLRNIRQQATATYNTTQTTVKKSCAHGCTRVAPLQHNITSRMAGLPGGGVCVSGTSLYFVGPGTRILFSESPPLHWDV